jgi:hypothetical protein
MRKRKKERLTSLPSGDETSSEGVLGNRGGLEDNEYGVAGRVDRRRENAAGVDALRSKRQGGVVDDNLREERSERREKGRKKRRKEKNKEKRKRQRDRKRSDEES